MTCARTSMERFSVKPGGTCFSPCASGGSGKSASPIWRRTIAFDAVLMDPFHERLARIALDTAGSHGFALAGGYAIQAYGFLSRLSSDVDIFTSSRAEVDFEQAVDSVVAAYGRASLEVTVEMRGPSFARLDVASGKESAKVELGVDWRNNEPVRFAIGPVLHADD